MSVNNNLDFNYDPDLYFNRDIQDQNVNVNPLTNVFKKSTSPQIGSSKRPGEELENPHSTKKSRKDDNEIRPEGLNPVDSESLSRGIIKGDLLKRISSNEDLLDAVITYIISNEINTIKFDGITIENPEIVARIMSCESIRAINFSGNNTSLGKVLVGMHKESLRHINYLNLDKCKFGESCKGEMRIFFDNLEYSNVKTLSLKSIYLESVLSSLFPHMRKLECLNLEWPRKREVREGRLFPELLRHLPHSGLRTLVVTKWELNDEHIKELIKVVPGTLLKEFVFDEHRVSKELVDALHVALSMNESKTEAKEFFLEDYMEIDAREVVVFKKTKKDEIKHYDRLHFILYDFNLDAVPAILDAVKEKYWKNTNAAEIGTLPVHFTIIKPRKQPGETTASGDQKINEELKLLIKGRSTTIAESEEEMKACFKADANELRVYIGETVNCGSTSRVTKGNKGNLGDGSDLQTTEHLNRLKSVVDYANPDIILSENHTFPYELKKKIKTTLGDGKKTGYQIDYQRIHHAAYTQEYRSRFYLIATRSGIKSGIPEQVQEQFSQNVRPLLELSAEPHNISIHPIPSQKKLLEDIHANFAAAYQLAEMYPDEYKIEIISNKIVLKYQDQFFWLMVGKDREHKIYCDSFVFINPESNDIRIVKKENDNTSSWMQSRFFHHANPRVTRTITSLDMFGTNIWGPQLKTLSPYEVARVHGCSKQFSRLIQENYRDAAINKANAYVGHVYSTKVVSRLLVSTLWKEVQNQLEYTTQKYPESFSYLYSTPLDSRSEIMPHAKGGAALIREGSGLIMPATPHMRWVPVTQQMVDDFSREEEWEDPVDRSVQDSQKIEERIRRLDWEQSIRSLLTEAGKTIYSHQIEGVSWLLAQRIQGRKGGILADDMGLGKTIQTVIYLKMMQVCTAESGLSRPFLIIVPLRLRDNWEKDLAVFFEQEKIHFMQYREDFTLNAFQSKEVFIATEEFIKRHSDLIEDISFDTIIIDEAQDMRNPETGFSKCAKQLKGEFKMCLSGTPLENEVKDVVNLLLFINDALPLALKDEYEEGEITALESVLKNYMLRRLKEDLELDLGLKIIKEIDFDLHPLQKKMIELVDQHTKTQFAKLTMHSQICNHPLSLNEKKLHEIRLALPEDFGLPNYPKIDELLNILTELYAGGYDPVRHRPFIIFSRFNEALKIIHEKIKLTEIFSNQKPVLALSEDSDFPKIIEDFGKGEYSGILLNLKQGKGLNLQKANQVFLFDPWWNPQVESQAVDRAYRINQIGNVMVYRFRMRDSLELDLIEPTQQKKLAIFKRLMDASRVIEEGERMEIEKSEYLMQDEEFLSFLDYEKEPYVKYFDDFDWNAGFS